MDDKFKNFDDLFEDLPDQTDDSGNLLFAETSDEKKSEAAPAKEDDEKWKILIVDDEEDIHSVTRIALKGFTFRGKSIEFYDAYSAAEAEEILKEYPDIALILLDVVMETTNAGLDLVKVIREKLGNKVTQIIIRTGQPGQAPEREVIVSYEINDYKTKTELTSFKLFTVALASLRAYDSIQQIGRLNEEFKKEIHRRIRREKVLVSAKEKAEKSEQLKSEFLQQMSEKIQEPLNLILSSSDQLRNEVKDQVNENIQRMLDDMNFSGREIIRAVQMITDLSEIQSGNYELNSSKISITPLVKDVLQEHEILSHRNSVDVIVETKAGNDKITTDEYAFQQIISNLLDNAIKNTRKGRVEVEIKEPEQDMIEIRVKDTGKGISKAFQNEMFEPFRRDKQNGPSDHGLGLGLTLTKEFCNLLKAEIRLTSEPGKGTEAILSMPLK
jgi:signal transduction histidine kinase